MLKSYDAITSIAVKDLEVGRAFYEGTLGFEPEMEDPAGIVYKAGASRFMMYQSTFAGTNKATYMTFGFPGGEGFDDEVTGLRAASIALDTFDLGPMPGAWVDGVLTMEDGNRGVWFHDPDGNILNLTTVPEM